MPEIELLGEDRARVTWAMTDLLIGPMNGEMAGIARIEGSGHYLDDCVRDDAGDWRIARQELVRLYVATTREDRRVEHFGDGARSELH
jgi:predicted secreted protein